MCTAAVCYQMEVVYTLSSPRGPAGTSRLHEEVAQMPVASTLINNAAQAKHSWGVPCDWLAEEEMTRAEFIGGSAHDAGTTQKWTAGALQFLSGTTLRYTAEPSACTELWAVHMAMHFV